MNTMQTVPCRGAYSRPGRNSFTCFACISDVMERRPPQAVPAFSSVPFPFKSTPGLHYAHSRHQEADEGKKALSAVVVFLHIGDTSASKLTAS